jgi:hypothetical protein
MTTATANKTAKSSHGGNEGRSLIERIEIQMDKRRNIMERLVTEHGNLRDFSQEEILASVEHNKPIKPVLDYSLNRGRYEGLAAALAILRSSTVAQEISRSNERLGIE